MAADAAGLVEVAFLAVDFRSENQRADHETVVFRRFENVPGAEHAQGLAGVLQYLDVVRMILMRSAAALKSWL